MQPLLSAIFILSLFLSCAACERETTSTVNNMDTGSNRLWITIGAATFNATLENSPTAIAFKAMLPLTLDMTDLNGNEKYATLSRNLATNASNPRTIQAGDLMLYGSNTLVLFYETFATAYSYTKLGQIADPTGLAAALGSGEVTVKFELD